MKRRQVITLCLLGASLCIAILITLRVAQSYLRDANLEHEVLLSGGIPVFEETAPKWFPSCIRNYRGFNRIVELHCQSEPNVSLPPVVYSWLPGHPLWAHRCIVSHELIKAVVNAEAVNTVYLDFTNAQDNDLKLLSSSASITRLSISGTSCTERGLGYLSRMPKLSELDATHLSISDVGASRLSSCQNLEYLDISFCDIDTKAIKLLLRLPKLKQLLLRGLELEKPELQALQRMRPDVQIMLSDEPLLKQHGINLDEERLFGVNVNGDVWMRRARSVVSFGPEINIW